jgi:hypothetical protein
MPLIIQVCFYYLDLNQKPDIGWCASQLVNRMIETKLEDSPYGQ